LRKQNDPKKLQAEEKEQQERQAALNAQAQERLAHLVGPRKTILDQQLTVDRLATTLHSLQPSIPSISLAASSRGGHFLMVFSILF